MESLPQLKAINVVPCNAQYHTLI
uniref:Uncharacterized protein n=1 Tax=Arundo donax TaxID=35708 RepID=A0A0A9AJX9_ARUDO